MDFKMFFMPKGRIVFMALILMLFFYLIANPGEDYVLAIGWFIIFYLISCTISYVIGSVHR